MSLCASQSSHGLVRAGAQQPTLHRRLGTKLFVANRQRLPSCNRRVPASPGRWLRGLASSWPTVGFLTPDLERNPCGFTASERRHGTPGRKAVRGSPASGAPKAAGYVWPAMRSSCRDQWLQNPTATSLQAGSSQPLYPGENTHHSTSIPAAMIARARIAPSIAAMMADRARTDIALIPSRSLNQLPACPGPGAADPQPPMVFLQG